MDGQGNSCGHPRIEGEDPVIRIIAALLAMTTTANAEAIFYDGGGQIGPYIQRAKSAEPIEIRGECYSACTLLLTAKKACVSRNAVLYFHLPSVPQPDGTQRVAPEFEEWVMSKYPEPVQDLIMEYGGLKPEFTAIPGDVMIDFAGIKDCDKPLIDSSKKLWFE